MELRHSGIKVSLIEPGPIRTRFTENVNQTQAINRSKTPASPHVLPSGRRRWWKVRHAFSENPNALSGHAGHPRGGLLKRLLPAGDGQNYTAELKRARAPM
jgi:NAD(P)-dependent dehydrogenase (short-subunit alcohol dehydrogenase family)